VCICIYARQKTIKKVSDISAEVEHEIPMEMAILQYFYLLNFS
jgi:hypothetical protein